MPFRNAFEGRRVLVTGHTGFKGAWLCEWLLKLGAEVTGLSLPPPSDPALFELLELKARCYHHICDIRDFDKVRSVVSGTRPDYVFHLAAQSLVRASYADPLATFSTNVMGTVNLLEALRCEDLHTNVVVVTTDKCYENKEWIHSYREVDPMGGYDPYSASKGATELVVDSYRRSFFSGADSKINVASARAGNVIGGGDWALDRIVPDCVRALAKGDAIAVRNKVATRPWQHVLEPLSGYLWLGCAIGNQSSLPANNLLFKSSFNFGPTIGSNRSVASLVQEILKHWPGTWLDQSDPSAPHEASLLNLAIDKAYHLLRWQPVWNFSDTVERTIAWYKQVLDGNTKIEHLTSQQIDDFVHSAQVQSIEWAS